MREFKGFTRGINFGGWLSQCDHTKERYDTFITAKDFEIVKSRGYDHIRVPVDYELFEDDNLNITGEGFKYIDFAIEECRKNGLNMVLDLHRTPGYCFDEGYGEKGFFEEEKYQEHFLQIWDTLAERYGKNADMLAFEMLNEVTKKEYSDIWNRLSTECIRHIRKFAPTIPILLGGYYNNAIEALTDLPMPLDENIIYNFHCYEPLIFTHQGAYWIPTMDTSFRMPYHVTYGQMNERSKEQLGYDMCGFEHFDSSCYIDIRYFEWLFSEAVRVAEERNVPLYCGEYGVIDLIENTQDRKDWINDFHAAMDKFSIGHAIWTYKEMDFEVPQ